MKRLSLFAALLLLGPLVRALPAQETATPAAPARTFSEDEQKVIDKSKRLERELVRLVEKVRPASVTIENWRGKPPRKGSGGSGVIVSSRGHILTNQHVVQGAAEIWIVLEDHRRFLATVVGNDPRGDVALLKIEARGISYKDVRRANIDRLSAGEWVIATGNPFFLGTDGEAVVTLGVVSGLGRALPGKFFYGDAIQHDAKINPGNSGGPLWDTNGNLLGLNGKIATSEMGALGQASSSGAGYTIPVNQIRNFIEAMLEGRPVQHGDELLGVKVKSHQDKNGTADGAEVVEVKPGSPAATARAGGVLKGDVIVRVAVSGSPREVRTFTDFVTLVSPLATGTKISLTVVRGYKRIVIPNIKLVPPKPRKKGRGK